VSRQIVLDGSLQRLVNFDDPPPVAEGLWALVVGRVVDEETDRPITGNLIVSTAAVGVTPRVGGDGGFALAGRPWLIFPPLAAASYLLTATVTADGYLPADVAITVPIAQRHLTAPAPAPGSAVITLDSVAQLSAGQLLAIGPVAGAERARIRHLGPGAMQVTLDGGLFLPHALGDPVVADAWTPVDIGILTLRRDVTVLRGRTMRRDPITNTDSPVAGALISVTDFWTSLADVRAGLPGRMTTPNPALRMFAATLTPGVTTRRSVGPGQVASRTLAPTAPPDDRRLVSATVRGQTSFRISDRSSIAPAALLRLNPERSEATETVTVTTVTGYAPADGPGDISTALPLYGSHAAGTRVVPVTESAVQPAAALRRDVRAGDRVLFVDDLTNLPDGADVAISDGVTPQEYQGLRRLEATSDAGGYFALPPIHRVAALSIVTTAPLLTPVLLTVRPDYTVREHLIDVVFA